MKTKNRRLPTEVCTVKVGDTVFKETYSGRMTEGKVIAINATVVVTYGPKLKYTHQNCIIIKEKDDTTITRRSSHDGMTKTKNGKRN